MYHGRVYREEYHGGYIPGGAHRVYYGGAHRVYYGSAHRVYIGCSRLYIGCSRLYIGLITGGP